jgi:hypothetical protein
LSLLAIIISCKASKVGVGTSKTNGISLLSSIQ